MRTFRGSGERRKPVTFAVGAEKFSVPMPLPAVAVLDMVASSVDDDPAVSAGALRNFFVDVMGEEETKRVFAAFRDERLPIEGDEDSVQAVIAYIMEAASGSPLDMPSPSQRSRSKTGK